MHIENNARQAAKFHYLNVAFHSAANAVRGKKGGKAKNQMFLLVPATS